MDVTLPQVRWADLDAIWLDQLAYDEEDYEKYPLFLDRNDIEYHLVPEGEQELLLLRISGLAVLDDNERLIDVKRKNWKISAEKLGKINVEAPSAKLAAMYRTVMVEAEREMIRNDVKRSDSAREMKIFSPYVTQHARAMLEREATKPELKKTLLQYSGGSQSPVWLQLLRNELCWSRDYYEHRSLTRTRFVPEHFALLERIVMVFWQQINMLLDPTSVCAEYLLETVWCYFRVLMYFRRYDIYLAKEESKANKPLTIAVYDALTTVFPAGLVEAFERSEGFAPDADALWGYCLRLMRKDLRLYQDLYMITNTGRNSPKKKRVPREIMLHSEDLDELTLYVQHFALGKRLAKRYLQILERHHPNKVFLVNAHSDAEGEQPDSPVDYTDATLRICLKLPRARDLRSTVLGKLIQSRVTSWWMNPVWKTWLRMLQSSERELRTSTRTDSQSTERFRPLLYLLSINEEAEDMPSAWAKRSIRILLKVMDLSAERGDYYIVLHAMHVMSRLNLTGLASRHMEDRDVNRLLAHIGVCQKKYHEEALVPSGRLIMDGFLDMTPALELLASSNQLLKANDCQGLLLWIAIVRDLPPEQLTATTRQLRNMLLIQLDKYRGALSNLVYTTRDRSCCFASRLRLKIRASAELEQMVILLFVDWFGSLSSHSTTMQLLLRALESMCVPVILQDSPFHMFSGLSMRYARPTVTRDDVDELNPMLNESESWMDRAKRARVVLLTHARLFQDQIWFKSGDLVITMMSGTLVACLRDEGDKSQVGVLRNRLKNVPRLIFRLLEDVVMTREIVNKNLQDGEKPFKYRARAELLAEMCRGSSEDMRLLSETMSPTATLGTRKLLEEVWPPLLLEITLYSLREKGADQTIKANLEPVLINLAELTPVFLLQLGNDANQVDERNELFGMDMCARASNVLMMICPLTLLEVTRAILTVWGQINFGCVARIFSRFVAVEVSLRASRKFEMGEGGQGEDDLQDLRKVVEAVSWCLLFIGNLAAEPEFPSWRPRFEIVSSDAEDDRAPDLYDLPRAMTTLLNERHYNKRLRDEYNFELVFALANVSRHALIRSNFDIGTVLALGHVWRKDLKRDKRNSEFDIQVCVAAINLCRHPRLRKNLFDNALFCGLIIKVLKRCLFKEPDDAGNEKVVIHVLDAIRALTSYAYRPAQDYFGDRGMIVLVKHALVRACRLSSPELAASAYHLLTSLAAENHERNNDRMFRCGLVELLGRSQCSVLSQAVHRGLIRPLNALLPLYHSWPIQSIEAAREAYIRMSLKSQRLRARFSERLVKMGPAPRG